MDKQALGNKIKQLEGLTNDEKSALLELLNSQKKYGLVWEDKPEEVEEQLREKIPILIEVKERAILNDTEADKHPNHILIEGDNLHALTSLCYTHEGKIDVIYIDPPYNTGNKDFVYNDSFVDSEDSFRHSKWLSFMERRLKLAKRLLSEEGVIFISIDDNEAAQLKLLCDEVFSYMDFVAQIPWRKRTAKADVPHSLSQDYEWILCYAERGFRAGIRKESRKYYETPDLKGKPWRIHDLTQQKSAEERPNSYFTIVNPRTGEEYPANKKSTWRVTLDTFPKYLMDNRIVFPGDYEFLKISKPVFRYFKEDDIEKDGIYFGMTSVSSNLPQEVGMTQDGTKDMNDLFEDKIFGFPKPLCLIRYLLKIATPLVRSATILDFFAGSGTTLHATMQLNADGGHRQCILVTNNENNICEEVTYERNKRVINGYTTPKGAEVKGLSDNNLRYYRTNFIERKQTQRNKRQLVAAATELLCIKENIYIEQTQFGSLKLQKQEARYFAEKGKQMLILYKEEMIDDFIEQIERLNFEGKLKTYVFAPGEYPYTDDFEMVLEKVELCALPDAIYKAYKQVLPAMKEAIIETHAVETDVLDNDHWEINE